MVPHREEVATIAARVFRVQDGQIVEEKVMNYEL
jgi:ABC-type lipoprotein export system ATPase subunit